MPPQMIFEIDYLDSSLQLTAEDEINISYDIKTVICKAQVFPNRYILLRSVEDCQHFRSQIGLISLI